MKFTKTLSNSVDSAKCNRVKLTHQKNHTTNCVLTADIFKRECKEYDNGTLIVHRDLYIGERL